MWMEIRFVGPGYPAGSSAGLARGWEGREGVVYVEGYGDVGFIVS